MTATIILAAIIIIIVALLLYFVTIYNGLVKVKNNVAKHKSNIDVNLKQRFHELPKLVKVCERYMSHEAETLEKVIKARSAAAEAKTVKENGEADGMITEALKSLFAVSENYPELKADRRFGQLQSRISELENEISDRRELYNESVNIYNIRIARIPDTFIAGPFGYCPLELWRIERAHRNDPGVSFSS
jgi:LemA protein